MKIDAIDIRKGNCLEHEGKVWLVLKTAHTQPGKGGAYMQVEMKDVKGGTKTNVRFRSGESVTEAKLDHKKFSYLYSTGDNFEIMDASSFEQMSVPNEILGKDIAFLQDDMEMTVKFYNDAIVEIELPQTMIFEVKECEPVVKGQTATSSYKPAILSNDVKINVPQFINSGDKIVIKPQSREYVERAKDNAS